MIKDAVKAMRFKVFLTYTMKMAEQEEAVLEAATDSYAEELEIGHEILRAEGRLNKVVSDLKTEKDEAKVAALKAEENELGLKIAEMERKLKSVKRKARVLGRIGKIIDSMETKKLKRQEKFVEDIRRKNEEENRKIEEYNKLFQRSTGQQNWVNQGLPAGEDKIDKVYREIMDIANSREDQTIDEMYDEIMRMCEESQGPYFTAEKPAKTEDAKNIAKSEIKPEPKKVDEQEDEIELGQE